MSIDFPRGSEWRKWDLHVHSPKSFLNNQFSGATTDQFVQQVIDADIKVIGLTNYFRFADEELKEIRSTLKTKGVVVFPNLEFRVKPENKENEDMHVHILFSQDITAETINNFLARLKTIDDKYCNTLTPKDIESTSISHETLLETLKKDTTLTKEKDYFIIACPRGQGNFRPAKGDGRPVQTARTK